ncbi:N-terminal C2 in EEIG1 and EHBP1 proteins-domain-containing protein [Talaromyces proteolyticus]|uniref:N-terminal C2 in EEIG1 and EHBP1 proteins-domain-containing protein n=1 Tax=Talaromyces proteolyticus TaxID=1131652 RepID=A0AAD4KMW3_9EURO|nr:N-terminal C2 in EEIG1 and EHBP1 proteins-domain-containing protein [Talaromyces proteolyticus]KAH8692830.1 N-terminal C2 in EEIG1 and EHBP1 proteins-domain-containing protein [Talaromyces proteolyticus]
MMQAFVPKNRRPRFDLKLSIIDLNNVPLVCGTSYVKWHLPSSTSAEHRGHTDRAVIQDHQASWEYEKTLPVKLTIDRNHMLQECEISFEIFQEFSSGSRGDRMTLGNIKLNLAEYVDKSDDEQGIVRRYLMQDSKINSTLRVGILMKQIDGDKNFIAPSLKTAMVFEGIAGILPPENIENEGPGSLPSINISRETGDLQDMYRRTLAASWTCHRDELLPDQLIEDLFGGGLGYPSTRSSARSERILDDFDDSISDTGSRMTIQDLGTSPNPEKRPKSSLSNHSRQDLKDTDSTLSGSTISGGGRGSLESSFQETKERRWRNPRRTHEISEFDVRDDLRTWEITVND